MKKNLIAVVALALSFQLAHAQTEKGSKTLGLNLNYSRVNSSIDNASHSYTSRSRSENAGIGPLLGYFVADNWEVGINPQYFWYSQSNNDQGYQSGQTQKGYNINAFVNRYFLYDHKFGFRTGGFVGYGHNSTKYISQSQNGLYNYSYLITRSVNDNYTVGANLALVYFPMPKMGFTLTLAGLNYTHTAGTSTDTGGSKSDNVNFGVANNNLGLSVMYVFGGK